MNENKEPEKEVQEWKFHSHYRNEEVIDIESPKPRKYLAVFKDHTFTTTDPEVARKLKALKYEEWVLFSEEDMITLLSGEKVRLGDLPAAIRDEFINKPKKAAQDLIGKILSPLRSKDSEDPEDPESDEPPPLLDHQCPKCRKVFDNASALNGHYAHGCKPEAKAED